MRESRKLGAAAREEKPMHTGICGSRCTYSWPGITLRVALRAKSISSVTMARRWHLWRSERAPSGKTCRRCRKLSITREKQHVVVRTAQRFLAERHVGECPCRLDVMAIDNCPGQPPVVRLHKDAFSPQA